MSVAEKKTIDELFRDGKEIDAALRNAVQQALLQHKKAGNPVAEWRDGKVVLIKPEDIVVEEKQKKVNIIGSGLLI
jgi:isoaspartyl peptidase/L-asparaginase-like protein (Ntn-hydrolase superfamily)